MLFQRIMQFFCFHKWISSCIYPGVTIFCKDDFQFYILNNEYSFVLADNFIDFPGKHYALSKIEMDSCIDDIGKKHCSKCNKIEELL